MRHYKPFAVVPCCVFPRLFPHRRMPRQGAVASQGSVDLIDYSRSLGQTQPTALCESKTKKPNNAHEMLVSSRTISQSNDRAQEHAAEQEASGEAVVSHKQLMAYLQHKGGASARVSNVPFEGMSKVVYRL